MGTIGVWFLLFRQSAKNLMIVIMIFVVFEEGDRGPLLQFEVVKKNNTPVLPTPPPLRPFSKILRKKVSINIKW